MKQIANYSHGVTLNNENVESKTIADGIVLDEFQKEILNKIFNSLAGAKPQAAALYKSSPELARDWKLMLAVAIREKRLTQAEINKGLKKALTLGGDFFPSTGTFVSLCREEKNADSAMQDAFQARIEEADMQYKREQKMISSTSWKDRKANAKKHLGGLKAALSGGAA